MLGMTRTTATFTISLPPEMAIELERVCDEGNYTRSELIREALRQCFRARTDRQTQLDSLELPDVAIVRDTP